jgi:hypothetical protein
LRWPLERFALEPAAPDELLVVAPEEAPWVEDEPLLTCVKPRSDVPAVESAESAEAAGAELSAAGAAESAGAGAAVLSVDDADASAAGAADVSAAGAAEPSVVVVVASSGVSSATDAEKTLPATAASEAPAKNKIVKTKVVASRRLRPLGSRDSASSGVGLPPKSQLSLRVNHRGIAVRSF